MGEAEKVVHEAQETSSKPQASLVIVEIPCDGTAVVTLNRSGKRNALSAALIADLNAIFGTLNRDESVRVILLTGAPGGPFSGKHGKLSNQGYIWLTLDPLPKRVPT